MILMEGTKAEWAMDIEWLTLSGGMMLVSRVKDTCEQHGLTITGVEFAASGKTIYFATQSDLTAARLLL